MSAEQRIKELGIELPSGSAPAANCANAVRSGNLLWVARVVVLNGCSDLLVEIFAERGIHARSVLGASSLRGGLPVILKGVVEVDAA